MKLLLSTVVYLVIAAVLGAGIILMMHGKPALLIASVIVYLLVFAKVGCSSH